MGRLSQGCSEEIIIGPIRHTGKVIGTSIALGISWADSNFLQGTGTGIKRTWVAATVLGNSGHLPSERARDWLPMAQIPGFARKFALK